MNILLIGGGRQLGNFVLNKLSFNKNYKVDIFNRGNKDYTNLIFAHHYIGDRNYDYNLINKNYDCVIDLCAYNYELSFKSVKHFISYSKKYIYISTSYIHHFLSPEKYPINASVGNKKILYKYAKDKYKIECLVKENSANSHILRTVPLISNIDHTERTKNFIKLLGNKDVYSIISNKFIQINSANLFSDMIIKRLNINKSSVIDIAGCNISIKKIFEKLNIVFNDQQSSNDHNDIPFLDFNCTFPGNRISENHIIKIFQDIDRSILE